MKIHRWIKKWFTPEKVAPTIDSVKPTVEQTKPKIDLTGKTKGDIKKLKRQGLI